MANEVEIVVKGRSEGIGNTMNGIRQQVKQGMSRVKTEASQEGRAIGRGIGDSMREGLDSARRPISMAYGRIRSVLRDIRVKVNVDQPHLRNMRDKIKVAVDIDRDKFTSSIKTAMSDMKDRVKDGFKEAFSKGAQAVGSIGLLPMLIAVLLPVVAGLTAFLGTMIGAALTLGFGAAFVMFGAKVLADNKKLQKELQKDWDAAGKSMERAFKPLEPVLLHFGDAVRGLAKFFEPVINAMAKMAAPALKSFIDDMVVAFKELEPAMKPMMRAFTEVLGVLGPMMPGMFKSIANSLSEFAQTVSENKTLIATVFANIIKAIPPVIDAIGGLIRFMAYLVQTMSKAFSDVAVTVLDWAHACLGAFASVAEALARLPGPWQESMGKAAGAMREAQKAILGYREDVQKMPKTIQLMADIDQLEAKLKTAKEKLKDPDLSKKRKAELTAEISDLLNRLTIAKQALDKIQSKTVTVTVNTSYGGGKPIVTGGNVGAQVPTFSSGGNSGGKGVAGPGSAVALVGERGPELVRLPTGSSVLPNSAVRSTQSTANSAVIKAIGSIADVVTKAAQALVSSSKSMSVSVAKIPDILYKMDPRDSSGGSGVTVVDLDNPANNRISGSLPLASSMSSSGLVSGGGGGRPIYEVSVQIDAAPTGNRISDAILEDLRASVRTRGGDVQQVIGGKGLRR